MFQLQAPPDPLQPLGTVASSTPVSEVPEQPPGSGAVSPAVPGPSLADQIAPFPPEELWHYDIELMHHYATITADSLSIRPDMCHVWRVALPREGYRHSFVMHGILALAATHKAYLLPHNRKQYLSLADYHQTLGSEGYRTCLQDINDNNGMAIFAFASVVVLQTMALPIWYADGKLETIMNHFMELASLFRGIKTTLAPLIPGVLRTEFAPLLYGIWPFNSSNDSGRDRLLPLNQCLLPQDTWQGLQHIKDFQKRELPAASLPDYLKTIESLEDCAKLVALAGPHVECGAVMVWMHSVHESVLLDIAAYRPHGLLILAHYCVLWAALDKNFWYVRTWPRQLFSVVEAKLIGQEKFMAMLQWPRQKLIEMGV
ncbi:Sterol uptake control protein [Paramyrothecium foliicola]|nr:Sterol uptake control protein [Paramyrothecium foliicola]